jgi:hypothetical protein
LRKGFDAILSRRQLHVKWPHLRQKGKHITIPLTMGREAVMVQQDDHMKELKLDPALDDPKLFINRELSQLEFFRRVLEEAQDIQNPLLERTKFLSIVGSNLDEFYMVRVAGLKQQVSAGVVDVSADGMTPAEQLAAVRRASAHLMADARIYLEKHLLPELDQAGIHILDYSALADKQKSKVDEYFDEVVYPVLTPLAVDPGRPFPHISNLSLNLAVMIRDVKGNERFARIKVPDTLPRFVPIKSSSGGVRKDGTVPYHHYFVWLEQIVATHCQIVPRRSDRSASLSRHSRCRHRHSGTGSDGSTGKHGGERAPAPLWHCRRSRSTLPCPRTCAGF